MFLWIFVMYFRLMFQMIELLGPIPKAFALSGKHSAEFFNRGGKEEGGMVEMLTFDNFKYGYLICILRWIEEYQRDESLATDFSAEREISFRHRRGAR